MRDYRIHASSEKDVVTGGSCFNIKAKSVGFKAPDTIGTSRIWTLPPVDAAPEQLGAQLVMAARPELLLQSFKNCWL